MNTCWPSRQISNEHGLTRLCACEAPASPAQARYGLTIHFENHVIGGARRRSRPGCCARRGRRGRRHGPRGSSSSRAMLRRSPARCPCRSRLPTAGSSCLGPGPRLATLLGVEVELVDRDVPASSSVCPGRPSTALVVPGFVANDHRDQLVALRRTAVGLDDHVAGLEARLRRRPAALTSDHRAVAVRQADAPRASWSATRIDLMTPITPRVTLPIRSCGSSSRIRLIGMAKPMPMLPLRRIGIDRRVHPDDLAADVHQRPARVSRIDRRVGLEHGSVAAAVERRRADG